MENSNSDRKNANQCHFVTAHPPVEAVQALCSLIMLAASPARAIWIATSGLYPSADMELR